MTAHSLLDRLHEAHCCGEANGVAHGYALMDEVAPLPPLWWTEVRHRRVLPAPTPRGTP